jgi:formamidopyrimidine-DNA glycosylase
MEGARFVHVLLRRANLRTAFPRRFAARLKGRIVLRLDRRAKYLLAVLSSTETLVMHLGMSGSFQVERGSGHVEAGKHDHVVFYMSSGFVVTFNDPRRFGFMDLMTAGELATNRALSRLGPEPLSADFDAAALARACRGKKTSLKAALLGQRVVAGLGNIYVSEALHRARLSPLRRAATIATASGAPRPAAARLAAAIKQVLEEAVARSATAYRRGDRFRVYGRTGGRCRNRNCRGTIAQKTQGGRTTFYCAMCQR